MSTLYADCELFFSCLSSFSGWKFLLVPAYPGCPGSKAVKRSLLLLLSSFIFKFLCVYRMHKMHTSNKRETMCWQRSWYWCRRQFVAGIIVASSRRCSLAVLFCRRTCAASCAIWNSDRWDRWQSLAVLQFSASCVNYPGVVCVILAWGLPQQTATSCYIGVICWVFD